MTDAQEVAEVSPLEEFVDEARTHLAKVQKQLEEINLLIDQSQGEVDKLAQRNAQITSELHQLQGHFETVPREDIRSVYEAAQDAQQRLFTMRGQLEKLQSDREHLQELQDHLTRTLQLLEGSAEIEISDQVAPVDSGIEFIIQAQENERRRISRLIHDGPAQALSNFILQTEIAVRLFDGNHEKAGEELENLKEAAATTFGHVRDFIFDLRPMMLDDLGLIPTVRRYSQAFKEKSGLDAGLVVTGSERRIESHLEVLAFRSIQECLANIRDHAQATQAKITLDMDEAQVRASVEDNGLGFDADALFSDEEYSGSLLTLKERVEQVGGTFNVESSQGKGSRISISMPTKE